MRTCHFHSDRPGVGICMRCRVVICPVCCTRLGGINHCHACLKVLGVRREETGRGRLWVLTAALVLGAGWFVLVGLCWAVSGKMAP